MSDLRALLLSPGGWLLSALTVLALMVPLLIDRGPVGLPPMGFPGALEAHPLGTDASGGDVLYFLSLATRNSLIIAFAALMFQIVIGYGVATVALFAGAWVGRLVIGLAEALHRISLPLLAVAAAAILRSEQALIAPDKTVLGFMILVLVFAGWPRIAIAFHTSARATLDEPFMQAAREIGASRFYLFQTHLAPMVERPVRSASAHVLVQTLLAEAIIGFLGIGMPTDYPSLGVLFGAGVPGFADGLWWPLVLPGAVLFLLLLVGVLFAHRMAMIARAEEEVS